MKILHLDFTVKNIWGKEKINVWTNEKRRDMRFSIFIARTNFII
jgi:hypothetical protein